MTRRQLTAVELAAGRMWRNFSKQVRFGTATSRVSYSKVDAQTAMKAWRRMFPGADDWFRSLEMGPGPDILAADKSGMVHAVYRLCDGRRYTSHCGKIYRRGWRRTLRSKTTAAPSCIRCLTEMRT